MSCQLVQRNCLQLLFTEEKNAWLLLMPCVPLSHIAFLMSPDVNVRNFSSCVSPNHTAPFVFHLHWSALYQWACHPVVCFEELVIMRKDGVVKVETLHYNALSQWWQSGGSFQSCRRTQLYTVIGGVCVYLSPASWDGGAEVREYSD